jgi:hypothetical protein
MARAATRAEPGVRLLDLWSPPPDAGSPVGCIATTYTFDPEHFEEQCLGRFLQMESEPNESYRAYLIEREEKLSETFVCVLADQRHVAMSRSLRWHLLGVRLPEPGIQHAKLSVLLWERHLRIFVGSANLTEPAYRTNLEAVVSFDFAHASGAPIPLALKCLDFLDRLAHFAAGSIERDGPRQALATFLARTRDRIAKWGGSEAATAVRCALIPVLPIEGGRNAISQLRGLWSGPAPTHARVVSPFFDHSDAAVDQVYQEFVALMTPRGEREVSFASSGRESPGGPLQIDIPRRLIESPLRHPSMTHSVGYVPEREFTEGVDAVRPLHSKIIFLDREENSIVMIGSSNFTMAGMGLTTTHNAELNVAYRVPPSEHKFYEQCEAALPGITWVEDDTPKELIAGFEQSEDTGSTLSFLPRGFVEALYRPDQDAGALELWFDPVHLPVAFQVQCHTGTTLLDEAVWRTQFASSERVLIRISEPESGLTVRWSDAAGELRSAVWPVNASDVSRLVPPSELRDLALEDLILVLTSARPAFRVLAERAEKKRTSQTQTAEIDPHRRVNTSGFLIKRMRRLAKALEGLRARLERPISSLEGWRWRLQGPFGPIALARALNGESGPEGPFFVSEVAAMLKELQITAGDGVPLAALRQELERSLVLLRTLSLEKVGDMPANLTRYVQEVFPESVA